MSQIGLRLRARRLLLEARYTGTKDYNQRTKKFVESGKVDKAARDAIGKQRAKSEDPALRKK